MSTTTVPLTGIVNFSNVRLAIGQSLSRNIALSDVLGSSLFLPNSGPVSLNAVRGLTVPPIFQTFAPNVQSNALGIYSVRLINSNYTGAVMNLRRSSDNSTADFFSDYVGNLKTSQNVTYLSWSNGTTSVMTWYDQSGGARNATATSASGGNPPQLVTDPAGSIKYCIYFPNGSATASAYYGFTMSAQATQSMLCTYYTLNNTSTVQTFLASNTDYSIRLISNNGNGNNNANDFLTASGGYALYDGSFATTYPYFSNTDGAWHTIAINSTSATMNFIHIGHPDVTIASGSFQNRSFNGYMTDIYTFGTALSLYPVSSGTSNNPEWQILQKFRHIPSWRDNLVGCYTAESWTGTQWSDISGSSNHATTVSGTPLSNNVTSLSGIGGLSYVYGGVNDRIVFPNTILPSTYTLFHITRYNGATRNRILSTSNTNWLSGHWAGMSGVAFHNNWITQNSSNVHGCNWVLSTDQNSMYRSGQSNRTTASPLTPSFASNIAINLNPYSEYSDWAIANITVYNTTLPYVRYLAIEDSIATRYSLPFPIQDGLIVNLSSIDFLGRSTTWTNKTGIGYNFSLTTSNMFTSSGGYNFMQSSNNAYIALAAATPISTYNTYIAFTQCYNYTTDYRTLFRGTDHQLLIGTGTNNIGYWNNGAAGSSGTTAFIPFDTNVAVTSLSNVFTKFNMWAVVHSTVAPFVRFYYNPSNSPLTPTGTISSNTGAIAKEGIQYIGGFTANNQYFGNIAEVMIYNRRLSDEELVTIYYRYKNFFGI